MFTPSSAVKPSPNPTPLLHALEVSIHSQPWQQASRPSLPCPSFVFHHYTLSANTFPPSYPVPSSSPIKLIISPPSQVLAIGFLLVILSSALWQNYLPLLVVATYVIAPLPNWICSRCSNPDDFMDSGNSGAVIDFGRFVTGFLVVMGIGK